MVNPDKWQSWLLDKYESWRRNKVGQEAGVKKYAQWIGVSQQLMSDWLKKGSVPKSQKAISALVARYGGEVYDVLELPFPGDLDTSDDPWLQEIAEQFRNVPPGERESLIAVVRQISDLGGLTPGEYLFTVRAEKTGAGMVVEITKRK